MFDSYTTSDVTYRGVACSCMGPSEIPGANGKRYLYDSLYNSVYLVSFLLFPTSHVPQFPLSAKNHVDLLLVDYLVFAVK